MTGKPLLLALALLTPGCLLRDPGAPPPPREKDQLPADATRDFIQPASTECHSMEPTKDYPLNFCVVSKEDLMADGHVVAVSYGGREVQFCCDHCIAKFKADPAKYLAILDEAKAAKVAK